MGVVPHCPALRVGSSSRGVARHLVIVDDHPAVRTGLAALLAAEADLSVAVAATAAEAEAACRSERPDVLVADYHLPDLDGLSLCLRLQAAGGPPVVLYSAFADEHLAVLALIAGAGAMVAKDADPAELVETVRAVAGGTRTPAAPSPGALNAAGAQLEPEDLPVLGMLTAGIDPDEIARTLGIDERWLTARRWAMLERLRNSRNAARPLTSSATHER